MTLQEYITEMLNTPIVIVAIIFAISLVVTGVVVWLSLGVQNSHAANVIVRKNVLHLSILMRTLLMRHIKALFIIAIRRSS